MIIFLFRYGENHDLSKLVTEVAGGFNTKEMYDKVNDLNV